MPKIGAGVGMAATAAIILGAGLALPAIPSNAVFIVDGDSISAQTDGRSLAAHFVVKSGGKATFVANAYTPPSDSNRAGTIGVSSKKIADQTLNVAAAFAANPTLTHCVFHCGTNDISPTDITVMKTDFAAYCAAWAATANNVKVIYSCILKRTDAVGLDPNNEAKRVEFNAWAATQVGVIPNLICVVNHDATFDPAADPGLVRQTGAPADRLHPTFRGTGVFVQNIVNALSFQASSLLSLLPGTNVCTNPTFTGSGGSLSGATGVAPTGWTLQNTSGATVVGSMGTEVVDGVTLNYCDIVITGTATSASQVRLHHNNTNVGLTAGQWCEGKMRVRISNSANDGPAVGLAGWVASISNGGTFAAGHAFADYGEMGAQFAGDVRVLPRKASGSVTGNIGLYTNLNTAASLDIRIRVYGDVIAYRLS